MTRKRRRRIEFIFKSPRKHSTNAGLAQWWHSQRRPCRRQAPGRLFDEQLQQERRWRRYSSKPKPLSREGTNCATIIIMNEREFSARLILHNYLLVLPDYGESWWKWITWTIWWICSADYGKKKSSQTVYHIILCIDLNISRLICCIRFLPVRRQVGDGQTIPWQLCPYL